MSQPSDFNQTGQFSQKSQLPYQSPASGGGAQTGTSGKAIASLVLGLVSIVGMCFTAIPGLILGIMGLGDINRSHGRLGGKGIAVFGIVLSSVGMIWTIVALLIGMMLPAVQAVRTAARTVQAQNNMRQQTLGMLNYESEFREFPKQNMDGLSWRVHILKYTGHDYLYNQFHLDEPWDSDHNIQLLDQMPEIYDCPNIGSLPPGFTVYQVPYSDLDVNPDGPQALFDTSGEGVRFGKITDGSSNTIAVLEVDEAVAVEWTKPADWEYDPSDPTRDLGNVNPGTILVAMSDGSIQQLPANIDPETMQAMITRDGGEIVSSDFGY